ncbi:hypothetical protein N7532_000269 [Penicillium argentinense]|uniref:Sulfotransferase domain-containing protein n=1 Tax=Penicillium argentinense TaxID=1131581 RepID=A0A9W9G4W3_9EURO|nr:uncharacterized protein N7532_000269 [Penicillium argentinense]KAJ5112224.1 hypothetical protein N7532_000269 [Penicillium argentinense]
MPIRNSTNSSTLSAPSHLTPPLAIVSAEDLIEAYPKAKVVLVERDIEEWCTIWMSGYLKIPFDPLVTLIYHIDRFFGHPIGKVHKSTFAGWTGIESVEEAWVKNRAKYREHYELVRRVRLSERLLKFRLEEGGGSLCEVLGKEVPRVPFPPLNE